MVWTGAMTALITPMLENEEVDYSGLTVNISRQLQAGIAAMIVLGTTGEAPTLSSEEQAQVIKTTIETVQKAVPIIVGCGTYATKVTIANINRAEKLGADAALIVTPYYNCPTQEGILKHFRAIFKETSLPIILYNIPKRCGRALNIETLDLLAEEPKIIAIKEATGDMELIQSTVSLLKKYPQIKVLSGDDVLTLPMMALGAHGVISVVSNLFPEEVVSMVKAALQGDFRSALEIHNHMLRVFQAAFIETNPMPIKAMMEEAGYPAGHCRLPLCELRPESLKKIKAVLKNYHTNLQSAL
ncbi:MAG: 4-hydroxy-tetrahydrodipicolinate synthase [Parachlamydiales bacterium]|jgi:4-hydroxy-tetrahydrodipicolinate synthase